jgi:predicted  nucleic acid-binding Zn-ribbon protein
MYGNIRDDWRLDDIERKADEANSRLYELDSLRSSVDNLDRENREISSVVNDLRYELETLREDMRQLKGELSGQEY